MPLQNATRKVRRWTRSTWWSISSGWSDIWTLRRWIMKLRIAWLAVGLIGAAATYAWGFSGSDSVPAPPPRLSGAQIESICHQAEIDTERFARELEKRTGGPAQGVSREDCVKATSGQTPQQP